jgi:hypothetical protein
MSVSSPSFSPTDLAEAAAWTAGRGTGWKAEPAHVDSSTVGLGVRRPESLHGTTKAAFPLASPNDFAFCLERTATGIAVLGTYFEIMGVFATLADALEAGAAA